MTLEEARSNIGRPTVIDRTRLAQSCRSEAQWKHTILEVTPDGKCLLESWYDKHLKVLPPEYLILWTPEGIPYNKPVNIPRVSI